MDMSIISIVEDQVVAKNQNGEMQEKFGQVIHDKKDKLKVIGYRNKFGVETYFKEVKE